ncbi:MAG: NYN domain-containing protein [Gemmatimonadota bacterium]
MNNPFHRAPHVATPLHGALDRGHNAALLIDFDNVTMGIRSDLSRELKLLLNSEVIRGKVAVQRAYADWRRYPQYIVPLSEASIDLIFAPAYGSSKKNATDIRLAIDALELVFIRPEIYTFILLSGDSDFSSLVLKLKEYGKYVIGVGLQESSSDILVQNCDEYYSYSTLTGLQKTTDAERVEFDPWVLVEKAVERMVERSDVMRSDRLKQVMVELDASFEERKFGFAKFSKFLAEAAGKGLIELKKLDNGQYEVGPGRGKRSQKRTRRSVRAVRAEPSLPDADVEPSVAHEQEDLEVVEVESRPDTLDRAYSLLREAVQELKDSGRDPARDSDVKRRMLQLRSSFDEGELGFPKFSKFLKQAHDDRIVKIERLDNGQYEVALPGGGRSASGGRSRDGRGRKRDDKREEGEGNGRRGRSGRSGREARASDDDDRNERESRRGRRDRDSQPAEEDESPRSERRSRREREAAASEDDDQGGRESRRGRRRRNGDDEPQAEAPERGRGRRSAAADRSSEVDEPEDGASRGPAEAAPVEPEAHVEDAPAERPEREPRRSARAQPEPDPEPQHAAEPEPPVERAAVEVASATRTAEAPASSGRSGGLTPRQQKRTRGREGPPPLLEGQVVKAPKSDGSAPSDGSPASE